MAEDDVLEFLKACAPRLRSVGFKSCGAGPRLGAQSLAWLAQGGCARLEEISFDASVDRTHPLCAQVARKFSAVGVCSRW